ncbi:MAG: F0F1 ATP synthase subunit A [Bacteroidales bacterium]|nr:F0F1 ATP synthase subunit A [Bacteroidales bacterium]
MIKGGQVHRQIVFILLLVFTFGTTLGSGQHNQSDKKHQSGQSSEHKEEGFDPGEMIIDHIIDSHEWHIATIGETHITLPLPVILYHNGEFQFFWSSKFHHGHSSYKGYRIYDQEGPLKGKIVYEKPNGTLEKPLDLSITKNVLAIWISIILLLLVFGSIAKRYKRDPYRAPKGLQSLLEPLIVFMRDEVAKPAIGEHKHQKFMPFILSLFFFIFFNNLLGLIPIFPGGANVTGNIAVTGVLALFTLFTTLFSGNKHYWKDIFNTPSVPWWLKIPVPLMPIIETVGIFTKPFVLMVRLYANITAGHIVVLGFMSIIFIFSNMEPAYGFGASIVSVAFAIFVTLIELLVAFIQAYVFALLSALYIGMATAEGH